MTIGGFLKSIETLAGQTIGVIRENGQIEDCFIVDPASISGGVLSGVVYVDQGTTTPTLDQTGAPSAPFSTLLAGVTARQGLGGTICVVPADYSAEVIPALTGAAVAWSFIGLDFGAFEVTAAGVAPAGPRTILPSLTLDGPSSPDILLRSVKLPSLTNNGGAGVYLTDVNFSNGCFGLVGSTSSIIRAQRTYFGSGGVGPFVFVDLDQCGFFGSQSIQVENLGKCRLTNCYGETSVVFTGAANTLFLDLYTRNQLNIPVLTNGTKQLLGIGPPDVLPPSVTLTPDLTASLASPQAQINDIVTAGVTLGLWTDNRVP